MEALALKTWHSCEPLSPLSLPLSPPLSPSLPPSLSPSLPPSLLRSLQQYERIVHLHSKITARLPETQEGLNNFDVPTTVKDAEQLMQQDLSLKEKMINLFAESELKMDEFLASLKEQQKHEERMMVRCAV